MFSILQALLVFDRGSCDGYEYRGYYAYFNGSFLKIMSMAMVRYDFYGPSLLVLYLALTYRYFGDNSYGEYSDNYDFHNSYDWCCSFNCGDYTVLTIICSICWL